MSSSSRSQKSQSTCVQCRTRKVRCDGQAGGCGNCDRLKFMCSFKSNYQEYAGMYRRPKRRRVPQACSSCRDQKTRCSGDLPICRRCKERGIECVYAPSSARSNASPAGTSGTYKSPQDAIGNSASPAQSLGAEVNLPDQQTTRKAMEDFFRHIYPLPSYAFLHQASLTEAFEAGQLDPALNLAICGVAVQCRSLDVKDQDMASAWIDASEEIVLRQLERPSIVRLQALLLIIRHRLESRNYAKGFILVSIAARFAFGMRLNYENPGLVFFAQESRRRVLWALWGVEKLWAGGLEEFTLVPTKAVHLQLPCTEEFFQNNIHTTTESIDNLEIGDNSDHKSSIGLLGFCLRLALLRSDVLKHYKKYVSGSCLASEVVESISALEHRLQLFKSKLPTTAFFSAESLKSYFGTPWLSRYIYVNNSWHQTHCDVYRTLLPGYREAVPTSLIDQIDPEFVSYAQKQCYSHVKAQVTIFSTLLNYDKEIPMMDFDMAVCAYHCTRLLLYMSRSGMFSFDNSLQEQAQICLATIKKLFPASGLTADIRKDIELLLSQNSPMDRQSSDSDLSEKQGGDSLVKQPHLAPTAQTHQMLGRHSLVRRAKFVDDSSVLASHANENRAQQSSSAATTTTLDTPEFRGEASESQVSDNTMQGLEATGSADSQPMDAAMDFTQSLSEGWDWSAYQEPWDTYDDLDFLLNPERYTQNPWGLGFDDPSQYGQQAPSPHTFSWQQS